jgi:hypothetical protein
MKLKLKFPVIFKPDKNGEYPEMIAKRLIDCRLAEPLETAAIDIESNETRVYHRKKRRTR